MEPEDRLQRTGYAELRERIKRARRMDAQALTPASLKTRIGLIMDGYHTVVIDAAMNGVYRARKNVGDAPFLTTAELWYPPATVVRSRGRFNAIGAPMFYASNRMNGAIFEVRPTVGDVITVLVVRTRQPSILLKSAHIGLERSAAPELGAVERSRMLQSNPRFQAMLREKGIGKKWLLVDRFLSDMATEHFVPDDEQSKYLITNAIAEILFGIPDIEALNYPSVATSLHCLNICLKPDVADKHFKPGEVWMIRIEEAASRLPGVDAEGPFYRFSYIRRSTNVDPVGNITWSGMLHDVKPSEVAHLMYRSPIGER